MRLGHGVGVVAILLLLSACSQTQFLYERADWMALKWVDGLVDADARQYDAWAEDFAAVLEQHRGEQLPGLLIWLDGAAAAAEVGLNEDTISCLRDQAGGLLEDHARLIVPPAVRVLEDLSPQQVDELAQSMADRNAEYRDDYLVADVRERESRRFERHLERFERWTGRLTDEQRRLVEREVLRLPDTSGPWLEYREQQQQRLLAMLRADAPADELAGFLTRWWVDLADRPDLLVDAAEQVEIGMRALLTRLDASLSDRQRTAVVARLRDLHSDLSGVAAPGLLATASVSGRRCQVST